MMHRKCKKTKKFELCFKNWVLGGSLFSSNLAKKRRKSLPRKVIVTEINSNITPTDTNELNNKETIIEHESISDEERKRNSIEQTDDDHLYRDGAKNYEGSHNEVVEDKLSIEGSYDNKNHNIDIPTSEETIKENYMEQENKNDDDIKDETINCGNKYKDVEENKLSIRVSHDSRSYNLVTPVLEEIAKGKGIWQEEIYINEAKDKSSNSKGSNSEAEEDNLFMRGSNDIETYAKEFLTSEEIMKGRDTEQENEGENQLKDETTNSKNAYNKVEEDNPCTGSSHDVDNCNKDIIPLAEDPIKEKRIEEAEEEKLENVKYSENFREHVEKDTASHKIFQSDDNCEKNYTKVIEKEEGTGQEDNNSPDKDDSANCDDSNQEAEEEKLSGRNSQNGVNKNEISLNDNPSIENAANEKIENFSAIKDNHDEAGGNSNYSTVVDKTKNNDKTTNYNNNNRDYCQWGNLKITIYGIVNIYTNGKNSPKQAEKKEKEEGKIPPIKVDSMNTNVKVPDVITHDENDKGKENLSEKIKKKDESPSIQPETEGGGVQEQRQQEKQNQQNLQPDEIWSVDDCRILENLMVKYNANKWLHLQAQFFNWTDRMISAELIARKFHDDSAMSATSSNT